MNKNIIIAVAVVVILVVAAGGFFVLNMKKSPTSTTANNQAKTEQSASSNNSVISSVKEMLAGQGSYICTYTDADARQTKSYIKNGMIRSDMVSSSPQESGSVIIKNRKMYFWNPQKTGFTMTFTPEQEQAAMEAAGDTTNAQQKELMANLEKYKSSCKAGSVSDSQFDQPTDVKFTDMSKIMSPGSMGNITSFPTVDQQQVEKLMEQYKQP